MSMEMVEERENKLNEKGKLILSSFYILVLR